MLFEIGGQCAAHLLFSAFGENPPGAPGAVVRKVGAKQPVQIAERVAQGFRIAEYGDRLRGVFHDLDTCVGHSFGGGGLHGCRVLDAYIVGISGHDGETLYNALFVAARFLADLPARIAVRAKVIAVPSNRAAALRISGNRSRVWVENPRSTVRTIREPK